jgi:hypothetical protein
MKFNRFITLCAVTTVLVTSAGSLFAQDNGGDQQGQRRNRQGGGQGGGPGGPGGRNWGDPAQMQQFLVDGARDRLEFTNDTDWAAVEPLIKKVIAARLEVGLGGGGRGMFGGGRRGGNNGEQAGQGGNNRQRGGFGGPASPEQEALQKALDDNAPAAQIKDLLAKHKAAQKAKQAKLEAAQADLKKVLTTKQEAEAFLLGLVN